MQTLPVAKTLRSCCLQAVTMLLPLIELRGLKARLQQCRDQIDTDSSSTGV